MKPTTETTIEMNEKQAAEQIARLAKMFNKKPYIKERSHDTQARTHKRAKQHHECRFVTKVQTLFVTK